MLQRSTHKAFTLIELLVVIAIIAILVGIIFVGARSYIASQRQNSTRLTLTNLSAMLGELETINKLKSQPQNYMWWDNNTAITAPKTTAAGYPVDFWKLPYYVNNTPPVAPAPAAFAPLVAPGDMSGELSGAVGVNQRYGSIAVVNTMLAMSMLSALPANRTRIQSLPASQLVLPEFETGQLKAAGADYWIGNTNDSVDQVRYQPGVHVKKSFSGQVHFFLATNSYDAAAPSAPAAGGLLTAKWFDETAAPNSTPVVLDSWGNPIIFVPASGLAVMLRNGRSRYASEESPAVDHPEQRYIIVSSEGEVINNGASSATVVPQVTRVGRPFWASAGPDGDFSKGDDNVYSFEQP